MDRPRVWLGAGFARRGFGLIAGRKAPVSDSDKATAGDLNQAIIQAIQEYAGFNRSHWTDVMAE